MAGAPDDSSLPEATFPILVSTFATQGAVALGQMPNPVTQGTEVNLEQAKFAIDLLQLLEEKTRGNLDDEERKYLEQCLYQLRMLYIDRSAKK